LSVHEGRKQSLPIAYLIEPYFTLLCGILELGH
jgi:hypothetical protein